MSPGSPLLFSSLIAPLSVEAFCRQTWSQDLLHVRHGPSAFQDLYSYHQLESHLRSDGFFETQTVRLRGTDYGAFEHPRSFAETLQGIEAGKSLQLRKMERFLPSSAPLISLVRNMEQELRHPCTSISCYLAPSNSFGLGTHLDETEIFTLQIAGRKHWKLYHRELSPHERRVPRDSLGEPTTELTLEAGDFLYHPRGMIHSVATVGEPSLSVTIVFTPFTWQWVLTTLAERLAHDPRFLEALPAGNGPFEEKFAIKRRQLEEAVAQLTQEQFTERVRQEPRAKLPVEPDQSLERSAMHSPVSIGAILERNRPMELHATSDGVRVLIDGRAGPWCPLSAQPALEFIRDSTTRFRILDLPGLDLVARVQLIQALVRESAVVRCPQD